MVTFVHTWNTLSLIFILLSVIHIRIYIYIYITYNSTTRHLKYSYISILIHIYIYIYTYTYLYIYIIMKTMCPPGYHHNAFVATHPLRYINVTYVNIYYIYYISYILHIYYILLLWFCGILALYVSWITITYNHIYICQGHGIVNAVIKNFIIF